MAQRKQQKPNKKAPVYSADGMMLRLVCGLLLIAFGVLLFLAVVINMNGGVFDSLRRLCYGLTGGLAFLLPALPVWGGAVVLLSTQRKPPLRTMLLAFALYLLLLTILNLVTFTKDTSTGLTLSLIDYFVQRNAMTYTTPSALDAILARAYSYCGDKHIAGGLAGMLLGWPLWKLMGAIPAAAVCILLLIGDVLLLIRFDPAKFSAWIRSLREKKQIARAQEQQELQNNELAWQQEQVIRQQTARQNSPAPAPAPSEEDEWASYMPQRNPLWNQPRQQAASQQSAQPRRRPVTSDQQTAGFQPSKTERYSVASSAMYQEQVSTEAPQEKPRISRIFGARKSKPVQEEPQEEILQQEEIPDVVCEEPVEEPRRTAPAAVVPEPAEPWPEDDWTEEDDDRYEEEVPVAAPAAPVRTAPVRKQQPRSSWSETPPWEDEDDQPAHAPEARIPMLQKEQPADAWKPELKLPPRKNVPASEQVEMELPPPYVYPSMSLLKSPEAQSGIDPEEDAIRSQRLEETLKSFKIPARVRHVTHGPAISRFEMEMAPGIKVNKVTELDKNIAMNMAVKSVRIEAPIPGTSLVGVEVPNSKTSTVTLREVLESDKMREAKSPLSVALGKDIAGVPIICDLARMPHLLIAGATGSGKSVCINTMINSILYRCSPQEVRMILVDPKVVELQCYNGVPHLLIPVVSDPHKAAGALAWAVAEMMDRYKKFQYKGVRAIDGYNAKLEDGEEHMPRIVIIIDELADLMMTCKRDVEDHICRLAQLARAAGIHLVVATQRPSVDVITGIIKANIPSRIAFKVSSFIDSRTIIDRPGAEQLLGYGDMLYLPMGEFTPIRIQGCFLTDNEVNHITDFIRQTCPAEYDPNIIEHLEELGRAQEVPTADMVSEEDPNSDDSLLAQCIELAVNDGQLSTTYLQRRFKLGYSRAGRLMDEMEKRGIVTPKDGTKPRICLISREEFERMKEDGDLADS